MSIPPQAAPNSATAPHSATANSVTAPDPGPARVTRYWHRYLDARKGSWYGFAPTGPPGEELADLRAGLGQDAGTVPAMWPYYTSPTDGEVTHALEAEHGALALYGLHQQSQQRPMHKPQVGLGSALRSLRVADRFSPEALDRRVAAAVNATSVRALLYRLRGLVPQLRAEGIGLDYDRLMRDLERWTHPEQRQRVRRTWGLAYHVWKPANQDTEGTGTDGEGPARS
ncbi:type I-E CRISPR-associated protein Cse2/CasB [Streptomyces buecherae]|uniref:type I-E CRISPR-associated protein Cse2/CasB n=2 Tax=Streptomyces TaxID=1883 RepID=UPI0027E399EA|nr:type I-E CRISPR-associated protein Cse2/CasB [Streptomyces buecherae]